MSTKATVAYDADGDSFHLYEELMDGRIWLEVEVDEMEARKLSAGGQIRLGFPVPDGVLSVLFKDEYGKRPPKRRVSKAELKRWLDDLAGLARAARARRLHSPPVARERARCRPAVPRSGARRTGPDPPRPRKTKG